MNKETFLQLLEQNLRAEGIKEPAPYLDYMEEIWADMKEEGMSEEAAAERLGDPREIARSLAADLKEAAGETGTAQAHDGDFRRGARVEIDGMEWLDKLKGLRGLSGLSGLGRMINDMVKGAVKDSGAGRWTCGGQHFSDYDISIPPEGIRSLEILWLDGDVEVTAEERGDILICESRPAGAQPLYTELQGDTLRIAYTEALGRQEKGVGLHTGLEGTQGKDLRIELPCALAANLQQLEIRTASGDLVVEDIRARRLVLNTASGDMEGHHLTAEDAQVECVSGDVELELVAKQLFIKSVSGDMDLTLLESPENLRAQSVSGDMDIRLPGDSPCRVQHQSISGDVHIRGIAGNVPGAPEYYFNTVSGDIQIRTI